MLTEYAVIEIAIIALSVKMLSGFLNNFAVPRNVYALLLLPLIIFPAGFFLRLTAVKELADIGFFLTEFSFLFVYVIFAASLVLGQLRYWGKRRFIKLGK